MTDDTSIAFPVNQEPQKAPPARIVEMHRRSITQWADAGVGVWSRRRIGALRYAAWTGRQYYDYNDYDSPTPRVGNGSGVQTVHVRDGRRDHYYDIESSCWLSGARIRLYYEFCEATDSWPADTRLKDCYKADLNKTAQPKITDLHRTALVLKDDAPVDTYQHRRDLACARGIPVDTDPIYYGMAPDPSLTKEKYLRLTGHDEPTPSEAEEQSRAWALIELCEALGLLLRDKTLKALEAVVRKHKPGTAQATRYREVVALVHEQDAECSIPFRKSKHKGEKKNTTKPDFDILEQAARLREKWLGRGPDGYEDTRRSQGADAFDPCCRPVGLAPLVDADVLLRASEGAITRGIPFRVVKRVAQPPTPGFAAKAATARYEDNQRRKRQRNAVASAHRRRKTAEQKCAACAGLLRRWEPPEDPDAGVLLRESCRRSYLPNGWKWQPPYCKVANLVTCSKCNRSFIEGAPYKAWTPLDELEPLIMLVQTIHRHERPRYVGILATLEWPATHCPKEYRVPVVIAANLAWRDETTLYGIGNRDADLRAMYSMHGTVIEPKHSWPLLEEGPLPFGTAVRLNEPRVILEQRCFWPGSLHGGVGVWCGALDWYVCGDSDPWWTFDPNSYRAACSDIVIDYLRNEQKSVVLPLRVYRNCKRPTKNWHVHSVKVSRALCYLGEIPKRPKTTTDDEPITPRFRRMPDPWPWMYALAEWETKNGIRGGMFTTAEEVALKRSEHPLAGLVQLDLKRGRPKIGDELGLKNCLAMLQDTLADPWGYTTIAARLKELGVRRQSEATPPAPQWEPYQHPIQDWHRFPQSSRSHIANWDFPKRPSPSAPSALWAATLNSLVKPLPIFPAGACVHHPVLPPDNTQLDNEDAKCARRRKVRPDIEPRLAKLVATMDAMDPDLVAGWLHDLSRSLPPMGCDLFSPNAHTIVMQRIRDESPHTVVVRRIKDERWLLAVQDARPIVPDYMISAAAYRHWPDQAETRDRALGLSP